jgi:glycosyltransferase involved in cell wall biosynthesis
VILFFGFIRKYKGLDLLLEAMSDERIRSSGIKLLIAGEFYEDRRIYDEMINNMALSSLLILKTDFIPDSEVRYYLSAADFVIQPYKNATQSGVTPLAYHFEKPMLVTNVGGLADLVPDGKQALFVNQIVGQLLSISYVYTN